MKRFALFIFFFVLLNVAFCKKSHLKQDKPVLDLANLKEIYQGWMKMISDDDTDTTYSTIRDIATNMTQTYDKDKDGKLEKSEFVAAIIEAMKEMTKAFPPKAFIRLVFDKYDTNKTGLLDVNQVKDAFKYIANSHAEEIKDKIDDIEKKQKQQTRKLK
jgi:Ca2+-binding EF-hand superfamily protein